MRRTTLPASATLLTAALLTGCTSTTASTSVDSNPSTISIDQSADAEAPAPAASATLKKLPAAAARKQAAKILKAEDQRFRDQLAKGQRLVGTPGFTSWYQVAILGFGTKQEAFRKADGLFTADNEPTDLIEAWRTDNGNADGAIIQFAQDGTAMDAPNAQTRQDARDALAALVKADKDASRIAAG
ncbi:hypothetical protein [Peterkaempfera griseoplana]|uniref:hypothetical protein n=1 Tax=Peterkaempfera griseoplana TaxID=66896 RepID=UPI0006E421BE|nr:hypothetical protein [Peterkaempfera griseoplana]